jgi:hypothetical protein
MRSAAGASFGQSVAVKISVPGAPPPAPPAGCTGTPVIASFSVSAPSVAEATTISVVAGTTVTLHWGAVTNADSVEIDHGIGGVPTPGTATDAPGATTSYVMTAHCGGNTATTHVTVNVTAPPPPVSVGNFGGHWDHNFGTMDLAQAGTSVSGSYSNGSCTGTINGTISGNTLDGSWGGCGSGPIHFVLTDANHFDGNYAGSNKWCGARSGVAFAAGCGFAGHWNLNTGGSTQTADLTQTGNAVSGTYNTTGTVNGTVTGWTLNGTWHINALSGPFVWVINSNDLTFKGHYTSVNWCGWRNGQAAIPNTTAACHD